MIIQARIQTILTGDAKKKKNYTPLWLYYKIFTYVIPNG